MEQQTKAPPANAGADCEDLSLAKTMGAKYSLSPSRFVETLRKTYFSVKGGVLTREEIAAALAICQRYDLDPFLREVHCTRNGDRLMIMVGIDGWMKMAQRSGLCGIDPPEVQLDEKGRCTAVTVGVHREGWERPVRWTAYMTEWRKDSPTWNAQPVHMLSIKALKLALRFGFSVGAGLDLEDPDELGGAAANGAGHTMAPGVRRSSPLPEPVTPRPAAARTAGGTAAPEAAPAGGGGSETAPGGPTFRFAAKPLAAPVSSPREAAPPPDASPDEAPWDVDEPRDAAGVAPGTPQDAPEAPDEPVAVAATKTAPAASQAAGKANARSSIVEAIRELEGKLTAAGVVMHVSTLEELEEYRDEELAARQTELRGKLFGTRRGGKAK